MLGPPLGALLVAWSYDAMLSAVRADRGLLVLLVGVVLVDIVYRQLYSTLPLHLRDSGAPVGLYAAASTSGTMLAAPIGTAVYAAAPGLLWPVMGATAIVAAGFVLASSRLHPAQEPAGAMG